MAEERGSRVELAAGNNAAFCELMCAAHGRGGAFHGSIWSTRVQAPPLHPNAVTIAGPRRGAEQLAHIRVLRAEGPARPWAVKDSHAALPLAALGFRELFAATWIWREPAAAPPDTDCEPVSDAAALAAWERAWGAAPGAERLFLPSLLGRADVRVLAARRHGEIVAGAIASAACGVVGLTNVFSADADPWPDCAAAAQRAFPGRPLVGYERGPSLARAEAAGFEPLSDLRVWILDDRAPQR